MDVRRYTVSPPKRRLRVIEAMLEEGDVVKILLNELYEDLLKSLDQPKNPNPDTTPVPP